MKLTKYIPVAIPLLAMMMSCGGNEEVTAPGITNVPISYSTGGTRFTGSQFENGDAFAVWANYVVANETATPYIEKQQVTMTDGLWAASPQYFWPADGSLDFYAVYPVPEDNGVIDFQMGAEPKLYYHIKDFKSTEDLMVATSSVKCDVPKTVPLAFRHVLGKLNLQITNNCVFGLQSQDVDIRVESVTISAYMHRDGQMSLTGDMQMHPVEGTEENIVHVFRPEGGYTVAAKGSAIIGTYFFLPETLGEITVSATWTVVHKGDDMEKCSVTNKKLSTVYALEAGKVKTVNLVLTRQDTSQSSGDVVID